MSGFNGKTSTAPSQPWASESPFVPETLQESTASSSSTSPAVAFGPAQEMESPFVTEYAYGAPADSLRAEQFASLVGELHDGEFDEAVTDLVNEASAFLEQQFTMEGEDTAQERALAERALREYFAPLMREAESAVDRLTSDATTANLPSLTEAELDAFLDRARSGGAPLPPAMEQFLGKFIDKAKKAVKGAVKLAKKGVALASKLSPVHIALNKLKGLVRPLIERVLKFALDKLPVSVRPIARQLASKLFGAKGNEVASEDEASDTEAENDEASEEAAVDPAEIQEELDAELAGSVVAGEEFDRQLAIEEATSARDPMRDLAHRRLVQARRRFADRVLSMREGENPQPALEEFIPAILAAAKIGIQLLGRPRVVKYIAELVAPLISKYIGKQPAVALSSSLVDAGLRLMSLELTQEDEVRTAANTVVGTVEGAVNRMLADTPPTAWENETVLHGYGRAAMEAEAAASFPDSQIRSELHETEQLSGQWTEMPLRSTKKLYRKYSRVATVRITPQKASQITTFGGVTLAAFLRDKLAQGSAKAVTAKVHLYEIKRGTTLSLVTMHEKDVPGLGSARREAWSLVHPLTREAAGLLLGEPKLGRDVAARFLANRDVVDVGQRFYYLEIENARVRIPPSGRGAVSATTGGSADQRPAHNTQASFVIDLPKRELRLALFYAEADAQSLAAALRQRANVPSVVNAFRTIAATQFQVALSRPGRNARVIHEAIQAERSPRRAICRFLSRVAAPIKSLLIDWTVEVARRELEERYEQFAQRFVAAADAVDDGVTIAVTFAAPPILEKIKKLVKGRLSVADIPSFFRRFKIGSFSYDVRPGFVSIR